MENKKILFWVNCYGAWDPELRHPIETIGLDNYLSEIVRIITLFHTRVAAIYISGGMYDSLGRTECETVKPELERRFRERNFDLEINIDKESITSQVILQKFLSTWQEKYSGTIPLLFVDEARFETHLFTFEYYAKKMGIELNGRDVIIPIARLDNHPHSTKEFQSQKIEKMKELGVEEVARLEIEARKDHLVQKK